MGIGDNMKNLLRYMLYGLKVLAGIGVVILLIAMFIWLAVEHRSIAIGVVVILVAMWIGYEHEHPSPPPNIGDYY